VSIPPHTEQTVPVKVAHNSLNTPIANWMINPIQMSDNVYAARMLVPRDESIAAVRIINMTKENVNIPAGTELGGAEMAHMVDPAEDCTSSWSTSTDGPEFQHIKSVIDSLPGELTVVERREAIELLQTYQDVFSKSKYNLGHTTLTEHRIDTGDGTPRITLDYRALNSVTYKDSFPLPNIAGCLDAFRGSSWFGILDLRSSFYQVQLAKANRNKTTFITPRGQ